MNSGVKSIIKGSIMLVGSIALAIQAQIVAGEAGKEFAHGIIQLKNRKDSDK